VTPLVRRDLATMGWLLATLVVLCLLLPLNTLAQEGSRVVRVGLFEVPPTLYSDEQGAPRGLYADILTEIAGQENWELQWVPGTWAEGLARLREGRLDLMPVVTPTPERDLWLDFCSESILMVWGQVFLPEGSKVQNVLDLEGRRVAIMKDDINGLNFVAKAEEFGISCHFVEVDSHHEVFRRVAAGQVAAGVTPNVFGYGFARQYGILPSSILFDPEITTFATAEGLNQDLLATIDRYLGSWKSDSESFYYRTLHRWVGQAGQTPEKIPGWPFFVGGAAALVALLLLLWNRILDAQVKARTRELQASQAKIRIIFDQTYQFLGLLDTGGHLQEVNQTAADFLGAAPQDFIGLPFWDCPWWNHDPVVQEEVKGGYARPSPGRSISGRPPTSTPRASRTPSSTPSSPCWMLTARWTCSSPRGTTPVTSTSWKTSCANPSA
jgi:ABC-type amino acid transport substrate-binding protein